MLNYRKLLLLLLYWNSFVLANPSPVHEFTLENGLKLIVKENHRSSVVVSQVWYKVGASYEQEGKTGLAHLLEHMMFKGTEKYPAGKFSQIMSDQGASENAFTSADITAYFQTLEKNRLAISFELEADRMRNLVLREAEFVKEKQVVLEERRLRTEDDANNLTYERFLATAYDTSPYQNPVIGWMHDIENLTLADLQQWYQQWYAPNNAIIVVVGDVAAPEVLELAKQYFGPLKPSQRSSPPARPEIEQLGIKRITVKRPAKLPYLLMGYKVPVLNTLPEKDHWEIYALEVLASILDGGNSARLAKHLVRGQEIAISINASYNMTSRLTELFVFSGIPTENRTVAQLETALREQIKQLQTTLVDKTELERVKNQVRANDVYERDSLFYQGMRIGMLEAIGLNWRLLERYSENIKAVTAEQVQMVAQKYLIDDYLTVAVLEPQPLEKETSTPSAEIIKGMIH